VNYLYSIIFFVELLFKQDVWSILKKLEVKDQKQIEAVIKNNRKFIKNDGGKCSVSRFILNATFSQITLL